MEAVRTASPQFQEQAYTKLQSGRDRMLEQLRRVIVGQDAVIEELMIVLFTGSHALITGAPGLAKTLLIRSIARILDLRFKRIQFTPDLMPSDIVGSEILEEDRGSGRREFKFVPGPIFTNGLLADEINRTPPKTQSALLEAMEEKQVTVAGQMRALDRPFYVLATQNPIELEGTYPLPEAQLDRFMFNILIDYLNENEELEVASRTTSGELAELESVFTGQDMLDFARLIRQVPVAEPVARYAVRLTQASRPNNGAAPDFVAKWVSWGAGTRGTQSLLLGAKARALLKGRFHVSCADIRAVAHPALRHRILTNFRAEADGIGVEDIIRRLLETIPEPKSGLA
ncbi:MAG: AAA family ATPase [Candidatus Sumerlaeia bacterium]|nr:AAA family ATPase [Candidatus Sumerlaeia bacterium]